MSFQQKNEMVVAKIDADSSKKQSRCSKKKGVVPRTRQLHPVAAGVVVVGGSNSVAVCSTRGCGLQQENLARATITGGKVKVAADMAIASYGHGGLQARGTVGRKKKGRRGGQGQKGGQGWAPATATTKQKGRR